MTLDIPRVWTIVERDVPPSRQTIEAALLDPRIGYNGRRWQCSTRMF